MFSDVHGHNMKKCFLKHLQAKNLRGSPCCSGCWTLPMWKDNKMQFCLCQSQPPSAYTAEPGPIFRVGVTSPAGTAVLRATVHSLPSVWTDTAVRVKWAMHIPQGWWGMRLKWKGWQKRDQKSSKVLYIKNLISLITSRLYIFKNGLLPDWEIIYLRSKWM